MQRAVRILHFVEEQEFFVVQAVDMNLHVASRKIRGQFAGKHFGVASRDDDVARVFGVVVADSVLEVFDVLHLVDEKIVPAAGFQLAVHVFRQLPVSLDVLEFGELFVDVDDVGCRFAFGDALGYRLEDATFAHAALPRKHDDESLAQIAENLVDVDVPMNQFHAANVAKVFHLYKKKCAELPGFSCISEIPACMFFPYEKNNSHSFFIVFSYFSVSLPCSLADAFLHEGGWSGDCI